MWQGGLSKSWYRGLAIIVYYLYTGCMVSLVADTDALIKLTRCGAKEAVATAFRLIIPDAVRNEAITQGMDRGFDDAALLAANLVNGYIGVVAAEKEDPNSNVLPKGGEREVYLLFLQERGLGHKAMLASDDHRFLRRLALLGVGALTPGAVLVSLAQNGHVPKHQVITWLDSLRPLVSPAEYELCTQALL